MMVKTNAENTKKAYVASKVAPVSVTVVDVSGRRVPVGAGELVTTALAIEVACRKQD
jgi:hypothetical protein